jgi:cell wall-associated NlpC family hydrolase
MAHWADRYIGQEYIHGEADCGRLVCRVRAEVFGRPSPALAEEDRAASAYGRTGQIIGVLDEFAAPVAVAEEGDIVLMVCRARPSHVGVYCLVDGEPAVLHAMQKPGQVVLTKLRDLQRIMLRVEGFYRWK